MSNHKIKIIQSPILRVPLLHLYPKISRLLFPPHPFGNCHDYMHGKTLLGRSNDFNCLPCKFFPWWKKALIILSHCSFLTLLPVVSITLSPSVRSSLQPASPDTLPWHSLYSSLPCREAHCSPLSISWWCHFFSNRICSKIHLLLLASYQPHAKAVAEIGRQHTTPAETKSLHMVGSTLMKEHRLKAILYW